jgi:hypothetical protein
VDAASLLPDVRDGLTRLERVVLVTLQQVQAERGGRAVPSAQLYGRVSELLDVSRDQFMAALAVARGRLR